jgi:hypothetical protein
MPNSRSPIPIRRVHLDRERDDEPERQPDDEYDGADQQVE